MRDVLHQIDDRLTDRVGLGLLIRVVPNDLVDEVLNVTGKNESRTRLLPARMIVYYVLALTLFYGDAYEEVMRKLVNGLRFLRAWRGEWKVPTTGAISKAGSAIPVRVIEYRIGSRESPEIVRLVTTLTDHEQHPAVDLAMLYAERWEIELELDEIETHQVGTSSLLRSRKPELVKQKIWALLITHYAIRHIMHRSIAYDADSPHVKLT